MRIVGLDLAGKETNETGFCLYVNVAGRANSTFKILISDDDIMAAIEEAKPDIIAVDAPFSFPKEGFFRIADNMLKKKGFDPLSPVFRGMQPLVKRAMRLVEILRSKGYKVIEVFPEASEKILNIDKAADANEHEYDALLCALTGKAFFEKNYEDLEGVIIPHG